MPRGDILFLQGAFQHTLHPTFTRPLTHKKHSLYFRCCHPLFCQPYLLHLLLFKSGIFCAMCWFLISLYFFCRRRRVPHAAQSQTVTQSLALMGPLQLALPATLGPTSGACLSFSSFPQTKRTFTWFQKISAIIYLQEFLSCLYPKPTLTRPMPSLSSHSLLLHSNGACPACSPVANCISPITCTTASNSMCTQCQSGYGLSSNGKCIQDDACILYPCAASATCLDLAPPAPNSPVGRNCNCNVGYEGDGEITGTGCAPVNACRDFPCDDNAACQDLPPPAANSVSGRSCTCNQGFVGSGQRNGCISSSLVPNSLAPGVGASISGGFLVVSDTAGGQTLKQSVRVGAAGLTYRAFSASLLSVSFDSIFIESKSNDGALTRCSSATALPASFSGATSAREVEVTCTVPPGVGYGYFFAISLSVTMDGVTGTSIAQHSANIVAGASSTWRYPSPIILGGSLYRASSPSATGNSLSQPNSNGELIGFEVDNVEPLGASCPVTYGGWAW